MATTFKCKLAQAVVLPTQVNFIVIIVDAKYGFEVKLTSHNFIASYNTLSFLFIA